MSNIFCCFMIPFHLSLFSFDQFLIFLSPDYADNFYFPNSHISQYVNVNVNINVNVNVRHTY